jgi:hypothetical protein
MRQIEHVVVDCCWMIGVVLLGAMMTIIVGI